MSTEVSPLARAAQPLKGSLGQLPWGESSDSAVVAHSWDPIYSHCPGEERAQWDRGGARLAPPLHTWDRRSWAVGGPMASLWMQS